MKILVVGNERELVEFQEKFKAEHDYEFSENAVPGNLHDYDLVFDFTVSEDPLMFSAYSDVAIPVFVNAPKISLGELAFYQNEVACTLFGFNGLPTFLKRDILEASCLNEADQPKLKELAEALGTDLEIVNDRVGMVTPRIIFMIINEAYYTLQEGTAGKADIDQGMKLGTNYPYGPFEWCDLIGLDHVYETLEALYEDTKEERYKICPLLKQDYLRL